MNNFQERRRNTSAQLGLLLDAVQTLTYKVDKMSAELDDLVVAVAAGHDAEMSAITLLDGLAAKLDALAAQLAAQGNDAAAVTALAAAVRTDTAALAAAVTTDTRP